MAIEHIYGFNPVLAAIKLQSRQRLLKLLVYHRPPENPKLTLSEGQAKMTHILKLAQENQIPVQYCSKREIEELAGDRPHQNILLQASSIKLPIAKNCPEEGKNLLLQSVRDPQNLGSILRTALLMSLDRVFLAGSCCPLSPVVAKASSGALEELTARRMLFEVSSISGFFKSKNSSFPIIAAVCNKNVQEHDYPVNQGILLVGSEGKGLSESLLTRSTSNITIPMAKSEFVDSFNISVATGLLINKVFSL